MWQTSQGTLFSFEKTKCGKIIVVFPRMFGLIKTKLRNQKWEVVKFSDYLEAYEYMKYEYPKMEEEWFK